MRFDTSIKLVSNNTIRQLKRMSNAYQTPSTLYNTASILTGHNTCSLIEGGPKAPLCVTRSEPVTRLHPLIRSHQIIRSNQTTNSLFWLYQNECQTFDTKFDTRLKECQTPSFDMSLT